MANTVCDVLLTDQPLVLPLVASPDETGAVVDFWGIVRGSEEGRQIAGLRYEAHQAMAEHQLRLVAEKCERSFDLKQLVVHHRTGFVAAGEASLLVRVGSAHRAEAFHASIWLVDELKKRVPIWKHPVPAQVAATSPLPA